MKQSQPRSSRLPALACCTFTYAIFYMVSIPKAVTIKPSNLSTDKPPPSKQLCRSEVEYADGQWVVDSSIASYPYLSDDDYAWGPQCTEIQHMYMSTGVLPNFLRYRWQPNQCDLLDFDVHNFCRVFQNKTIGLIGDSMMQQFAHSLMGMMLGKVESGRYLTADWNLRIPVCSGSVIIRFVRWNKYQGKEEDRKAMDAIVDTSDYVLMNFGVHYQPWLEMQDATIDLIRHLETHTWTNKRLFWRSTIVAHANCSTAVSPDLPTLHNSTHSYSLHSWYNTGESWRLVFAFSYFSLINRFVDEIRLQEQEIVLPLFRASPLQVTLLKVDTSTLLRRDGHRVQGHNGNEDCLHYCEPGPTDNWVRLFYHQVAIDHMI